MSLSSSGINIDAVIGDPRQDVYKDGRAKGLIRLEIWIDDTEIGNLISAYPNYYARLLHQSSYSRLPKKNSAWVPITLVFGQHQYEAVLKKPEKRAGAWIPAGPVRDKHHSDIKLTGAIVKAGFPVPSWTSQIPTLSLPKPRSRPLQSVKFLVQGKVWTLVSPGGLTYSDMPPNPEPHR